MVSYTYIYVCINVCMSVVCESSTADHRATRTNLVCVVPGIGGWAKVLPGIGGRPSARLVLLNSTCEAKEITQCIGLLALPPF